MVKEALDIDPNFAPAWALLGYTHLMEGAWGISRAQSFKLAEEYARKAMALDDRCSKGWFLLGDLYRHLRKYDEAIAYGERAIATQPGDGHALAQLGFTMCQAGRFDESIALIKRGVQMFHPNYPAYQLRFLATAQYWARHYEQAIVTFDKLLERCRKGEYAPAPAHAGLAAVYAELGQDEKARFQVAELLKVEPSYSLEAWERYTSMKNPDDMERILTALRKAGLPEKPPLPLPDKPSIAVLPFVNMSEDSKQEYFSDGITEQIITSISKAPRLFVISRTSSFKYKGKAADVKQVGRELGVKYVLEGSVQRAGDRLRITAQLIDAIAGEHLWAERYDRKAEDIFALQDEITMKIMYSLAIKLTDGERLRLARRRTDNIQALEKALEALQYLSAFNIESKATALQLTDEAIALDPEFAKAYLLPATTHLMDVYLGSSKSPRESLEQATKWTQKAIALDNTVGRALLGYLYGMQSQYEKAIAEGEQSAARTHLCRSDLNERVRTSAKRLSLIV
jgi:TolB-like protein